MQHSDVTYFHAPDARTCLAWIDLAFTEQFPDEAERYRERARLIDALEYAFGIGSAATHVTFWLSPDESLGFSVRVHEEQEEDGEDDWQ